LLDDFEGFENPVPEVTENVVEMARQLKLEVEPQDIAELMGSHSQPLSNEYFWHLKNSGKKYPSLSLKALLPKFTLKFSVISKLAWLFWKSMIQVLKEVRKSVLTL
jgi:hypothetical protein